MARKKTGKARPKREINAEAKQLFDAYLAEPGQATQDAIAAASLDVQAEVLRRMMRRYAQTYRRIIKSTKNSRHSAGVEAFGDKWPYCQPSKLLARRLPLADKDLVAFVEPLSRDEQLDPDSDAPWLTALLRYLPKRHAAGHALPIELVEPLTIIRGHVRTQGWQRADGQKLKRLINDTIRLTKTRPKGTT